MSPATIKAPVPADIWPRLAAQAIRVPDAPAVSAYLTDHAALGQLLPEIGAAVRAALGPDVELSLEVYGDPEIDDRYLTLYARQERYAANFLDRLQGISERFNPQLELVPGYLLLATDFAQPRGSDAH